MLIPSPRMLWSWGGWGLLVLTVVWLERPGSLWGYFFHMALVWHHNEERLSLAKLTPFQWDKMCIADRSYYAEADYDALNKQVGVRGFDSRQLSVDGDEQGGYLLFVKDKTVIPIEWNRFGGFLPGAMARTQCWWGHSLVLKRIQLGEEQVYVAE